MQESPKISAIKQMTASMETGCLKKLKHKLRPKDKSDNDILLATSHHPPDCKYFTTAVSNLDFSMEWWNTGIVVISWRLSVQYLLQETLPTFPIIPPQKKFKGIAPTRERRRRKQNTRWLLGGSEPAPRPWPCSGKLSWNLGMSLCVVCRPAASASLESLLEMQNLCPPPKITESESEF